VKGRRVEVVLGAFDATDGEVIDLDENWMKLKKKNRVIYVQIDKIRRIMVSEK